MIMTLYVVLSRIILIMFKNKINIKELSCPKKTNAMQKIFISSLAALVVALSIYTHELLEVSERAIKYLFW